MAGGYWRLRRLLFMRWFLNIFPIPFGMLNFIAEKV
jgi:hypothetical protein